MSSVSASAANSQSEISFADGVVGQIIELRQQRTYEGLLEGPPTVGFNNVMIGRAIQNATRAFRVPVEVIRPVQKTIEGSESDPVGPRARIPNTTCIARIACPQPARDAEMDFSQLAVLWFQEDFAFPVDEKVLEEIAMIEWCRVAEDFQW